MRRKSEALPVEAATRLAIRAFDVVRAYCFAHAWLFAVIAATLIIAPIVASLWVVFLREVLVPGLRRGSNEFMTVGQLGDAFAPITSALGAVTFLLAILAFGQQVRVNARQEQRHDEEREVQAKKDELTAKTMREQLKAAAEQQQVARAQLAEFETRPFREALSRVASEIAADEEDLASRLQAFLSAELEYARIKELAAGGLGDRDGQTKIVGPKEASRQQEEAYTRLLSGLSTWRGLFTERAASSDLTRHALARHLEGAWRDRMNERIGKACRLLRTQAPAPGVANEWDKAIRGAAEEHTRSCLARLRAIFAP